MVAFSTNAYTQDLFVDPSGNDALSYSSNTKSAPWQTIEKCMIEAKSGDTCQIRSGTYVINGENYINSTYHSDNVKVRGYLDEMPVIDLDNVNAFVHIDGVHYWTFSHMKFIKALAQ